MKKLDKLFIKDSPMYNYWKDLEELKKLGLKPIPTNSIHVTKTSKHK